MDFGFGLGWHWVYFGWGWVDIWLKLGWHWVNSGSTWVVSVLNGVHWLSLGNLSVLGPPITILSILPPFKIPLSSRLKVFCNRFWLRSGVGLEKALLRMSEPWTRSDNDINMSIHAHQRVYFQRIHEYGFLLGEWRVRKASRTSALDLQVCIRRIPIQFRRRQNKVSMGIGCQNQYFP